MIEIKEDQVNELIKVGKTIIKVYDDGCPYCDKYEPVFTGLISKFPDFKFASLKINRKEPSEFRRTYMKGNKGEEKNTVPATLIFENGLFLKIQFGIMTEEQAFSFISGPQAPAKKLELKPRTRTKVKVSLEDINNSTRSIESLTRMRLDIKVAYWISKNSKIIGKEVNLIDERRNNLIKELGEQRAEDGEFKVKPENVQDFRNQFNEFLKTEVELELTPIFLEDLQVINIEPWILLGISFMISDGDNQ